MPGTIQYSTSRGHSNHGVTMRDQLALRQRAQCSTARAELNAMARGGKLSYKGWETDMHKAERLAREKPKLVAGFVRTMQRKQSLGWPRLGNRSDPTLAAIDALVEEGLSYDGWKQDKKKAERFAVETPGMVKGFLESMRRKEQVAKGDRSDPLLAAVDALVARPLTYPEWEKDVAKAEATAISSPRLARQEVSEIERKQLLFAISRGDRASDPLLRQIDEAAKGCYYNGKQRDIDLAERYAKDKPSLVPKVLEKMKRLQAEHETASKQSLKAAAWLSWNSGSQQLAKQCANVGMCTCENCLMRRFTIGDGSVTC